MASVWIHSRNIMERHRNSKNRGLVPGAFLLRQLIAAVVMVLVLQTKPEHVQPLSLIPTGVVLFVRIHRPPVIRSGMDTVEPPCTAWMK